MDHFQGIRIQIRAYLIMVILAENLMIIGGLWFASTHMKINLGYAALSAYAVSIVMTFIITFAATDYALMPLKAIWLTILHILPGEHNTPGMPDINKLAIGRPLVESLSAQIYQIASTADHYGSKQQDTSELFQARGNLIAKALPLPLILLDGERNIAYANEAAGKYLGMPADEMTGKEIYSLLDLSFVSDDTLDNWLENAKKNKVTDTHSWERVRIGLPGEENSLQFDLAAYYNKSNPSGFETMLVLFDHTHTYSQDDQALSFVALAVHELRTPLTLLRGYIEVFDEELGASLTPELKGFMGKMDASAETLAGFVDNILNVARIEDNQLTLQLHEESWPAVVESVVRDMQLRAHVRGIDLKVDIASDLPTVGADRYSIYEVLANLIDNAIKYSNGSKEIYIKSAIGRDGMVETTVQDNGAGIPESVMPHIFNKFYRNHRTRSQINGTGLGLYLSKAIVEAHGGHIWAQSKEGQGATFGFTVQPYANLAADKKNSDNGGITRSAHGWIKNHSLYRR